MVKLQHRTDILTISTITTSGLDNASDLRYDSSGGDQGEAWVKQNNLWNNEW